MNREKNHLFLTVIKWGLLIFTAARSIDLFMWTFEGTGALQLVAILGIFGLDLALMAWDDYAANKYETKQQKTVGIIMIVLNIVGISMAVVGDTARILDIDGYKTMVQYIALFGLPAMIVINLVGLIVIHQMDPDTELEQMERYHARQEKTANKKHELAQAAARRGHERGMEELNLREELEKRTKAVRQNLGLTDEGTGLTSNASQGDKGPKQ